VQILVTDYKRLRVLQAHETGSRGRSQTATSYNVLVEILLEVCSELKLNLLCFVGMIQKQICCYNNDVGEIGVIRRFPVTFADYGLGI
jgi:hypothetical protein